MSKQHPTICDFLIIGAGTIGINIALTLRKKFPAAKIVILEKEKAPGLHASGRNSGVLHAGFYYTEDSLKAKFSKAGNLALTQYCLEKKLPINTCGKLVVATNESECKGLQALFRRGQKNNIELYLISESDAKQIEPRAKTIDYALFSPTTSSVDPSSVITQFVKDLQEAHIALHCEEAFLKKRGSIIKTNRQHYAPGFIINAAGLYADKIAKCFGFAKHFEILPFKGLYLYGTLHAEKLRTHIYPVPNLNNPFLGVHFTLTAHGEVKIGPTAIPAFWREHYQGFKNFKWGEARQIIARELALYARNHFNFRQLAHAELRKYNRKVLVDHAKSLVTDVRLEDFQRFGKPGIRAQLFDTKNKKLEMDFVVEGDAHSLHILNAVSPAFTCAIPFSEYVVGQI